MSRKSKTSRTRTIATDKRFNDRILAKFINNIMSDGKKSTAEGVVYRALDRVADKMKGGEVQPVEVFLQALENLKPLVEVKSRRVGGANYQVPIEVRPERRQALAIRWLIAAARGRGEKNMADRLANELMDAYNKTGSAIKKREDVHRMAEANKAFAHYRW
jgi:small subunit ribosomal protein S7